MEKINWQNGTLIKEAFIEIDGTEYLVTPRQVEGTTPLSANNLNLMQDNIEDAINPLTDYISKRYKTLWTGTWTSGSITVNGASGYHSFIVYVDNSQDPIVCYRDGNGNIMGSIVVGNPNGNQYIKTIRASINGDVLTWDFAKELAHNASSNHGTASNKTIYKIVGLDPIVE